MKKSIALITGASGGIGTALAEVFARNGYDLVLTARRRDKMETLAATLQKTYGVAVEIVEADLHRPDAPQMIYDTLREKGIEVEILVNNAGYGLWGRFDRLGEAEQIAMVQLNIAALTALTHRFVQDMLKRKSGRILNVASTAAFQAGPQMAVYYATKSFVLSFSEALAFELKPEGIAVTCLCPGPTHTGFAQHAGTGGTRAFHLLSGMSAMRVAELGFKALMKKKRVYVPGFLNRLLAFGNRFSPRRTAVWISAKMIGKAH